MNTISFFDLFPEYTEDSGLHIKSKDNEDTFIVSMEVPGATEEMLDVQFKDDIITISIDYGKENELRKGKYSWSGKFKGVDAEKIEAKLAAGVLILTLPKKPECQPQKIKIAC